jgi:hypothetical protein
MSTTVRPSATKLTAVLTSSVLVAGFLGAQPALVRAAPASTLNSVTGATYVSLAPTRLLDTRIANGLSGPFSSGIARTFQVTGRGGVLANATAVTGNLTVTRQTSGGYVALTPNPTDTPPTSTLNFPLRDDRANGVTVPLSGSGTLSATYITSGSGQTTHLVFDVTGYFVPDYYALDYYNGHYATENPENVACVSASALTHVNYIYNNTASSNYAHSIVQSWYNTAKGTSSSNMHTRYYYPSYGEAGLDPRAWAWLLWNNTRASPAYAFHDYWWSGSSGQSTANTYMVTGVYYGQAPVGALTDHGHHAVDVVGFSTSASPTQEPTTWPSTLLGFWIVDPYAPSARKAFYGGYIGDAPNTYIALSTWNSVYFTTYTDDKISNTIWTNAYVAVLRSADGSPQPTPTSDARPAIYSDGFGSFAAAPPADVVPVDKAYPDGAIEQATLDGIATNQLLSNPNVGRGLQGATIGRTLHVESLTPEIPAYELVEVLKNGTIVANVMLVHRVDGLHFGALRPVTDGARLPDVASLKEGLSSMGSTLSALSATAVWAWSDESMSPFDPLWRTVDASGSTNYVTPTGEIGSSVHLTSSP